MNVAFLHVPLLESPFISADVDAGGRYTYVDLPDRIDVCLITHGHQREWRW